MVKYYKILCVGKGDEWGEKEIREKIRKISGILDDSHLIAGDSGICMRLYLDTNVIVDILERRSAESYDLFIRSLRCQHTIVISSWTLRELARIGYERQCDTLMSMLGGNKKVVFIRKDPADDVAARHAATHFADGVHYSLAKRSADGIVTWNIRDFPFTDIRVGTPRDF